MSRVLIICAAPIPVFRAGCFSYAVSAADTSCIFRAVRIAPDILFHSRIAAITAIHFRIPFIEGSSS